MQCSSIFRYFCNSHPSPASACSSLLPIPTFDLLPWLNYSAFDPRLVFHILLFLPFYSCRIKDLPRTRTRHHHHPPLIPNEGWLFIAPSIHLSWPAIIPLGLPLLLRDQISSVEEAPTDSGSCISYFLRTEAINYPE